jgi:HEAT repeat protein
MWQVVVLVAYGIGLWLMDRSTQRALLPGPPSRPQDWKDAAERCGLQIKGGTSLYPRFTAWIKPFEMRVETFGTGGEETRIEVKAPVAPDFETVKIRPQASGGAGDITAGDPGFDDALTLDGPALTLLALLDSNTRQHMRAVSAVGRLEVGSGRIEAVISKDGLISEILPSLLEIGKRLATPIDLRRSLVENVKRDSESGARLQNLLFLIRELPRYPGTEEALRAACSDWSSPVRLQAARALGAEGRDILLALAHRLEDDGVSAEAVSILGRELPAEQAKALLDRAALNGCMGTAFACLEVLSQGRAEAQLIETLKHEDADIQLAAARTLGDIGSAAAVLPLKEARSGRDFALAHAARQAIAEIQARAEGASPGQLSLAGAEAGQLSLAETAEGQLSLTEDPAGQLSLPPGERSPWPK